MADNQICNNWEEEEEWEKNIENLTLQLTTAKTDNANEETDLNPTITITDVVEEEQPKPKPQHQQHLQFVVEEHLNEKVRKVIQNFMQKHKNTENSLFYEKGKFVLAKYCKELSEIYDDELLHKRLNEDLEALKKFKNKNELFAILKIDDLTSNFYKTNELTNFLIEMGAIRPKTTFKTHSNNVGGTVGFGYVIQKKPKNQIIKKPTVVNKNTFKGVGNFNVVSSSK